MVLVACPPPGYFFWELGGIRWARGESVLLSSISMAGVYLAMAAWALKPFWILGPVGFMAALALWRFEACAVNG